MSDDKDDTYFLALSARLRRRIDSAFDSTVSSGTQRFDVGGFVVEVSEPGPSRSTEYEAGGFIVEDVPSSCSDVQSHIPLSDIPRALNLLDLFPDDDIMGVFKNAATGWGGKNARNDGVSRKDWRAVCAALLEGEHVEGSEKENAAADEDSEMGADSGPDNDEYRTEELSSGTEEATSDEYEEPGRTAAGTRNAPRNTLARSSGTEVRQLTESQKAQCRRDFRKFFPHVPDGELDDQRIMIKDIMHVADLLKENLKTEQILDMLEAFSTSPDKSMNLADFEHMMILTKLV